MGPLKVVLQSLPVHASTTLGLGAMRKAWRDWREFQIIAGSMPGMLGGRLSKGRLEKYLAVHNVQVEVSFEYNGQQAPLAQTEENEGGREDGSTGGDSDGEGTSAGPEGVAEEPAGEDSAGDDGGSGALEGGGDEAGEGESEGGSGEEAAGLTEEDRGAAASLVRNIEAGEPDDAGDVEGRADGAERDEVGNTDSSN